MAGTVEFELVSPERLLLSAPVEMVVVPGVEGDFGVLPGHTEMISGVRPGVIVTYEGGQADQRIFVAGGFAEVTPERCTVLAEEAIALDETTREAAQARIKAAEDELSVADTEEERAAAQDRLDVAKALLAASERS